MCVLFSFFFEQSLCCLLFGLSVIDLFGAFMYLGGLSCYDCRYVRPLFILSVLRVVILFSCCSVSGSFHRTVFPHIWIRLALLVLPVRFSVALYLLLAIP